jgi:shikimate kinase
MIPPRKVYIVGGAGSCKSTLAQRLATHIDAPVFDLDSVLWKTGGPKSEAERD